MDSEVHKKCFKCGETKHLSLFYKHSQMADGHVNKCKECNKKDVRENREDKNEYYIAYDKKRSSEPERNAKKLSYSKKYTKENPIKRKAQNSIEYKIKSGQILKPCTCEFCGSSKSIHAHHSSYSEDMWNVVTWLCGKCHVRLHKDFEYQLGPWVLTNLNTP